MSRYIRNEILNQPEDFVNFMMQDFLSKHGFDFVQFKGQMVYRAGGGLVEMPKFFTWNYQNGVVHIEAWTRTLWLPGVYGKENDMTGFYGSMVKNIYKKDVEQLIALLHQPLNRQPYGQPGVQQNGMTQNQPIMQQNGMTQNQPVMQQNGMTQNQPVMVQGVDTSRYANMALGFGIGGLFMCWSFLGIIVDAIALIYGIKGQKSSKKGRATAGLVCAIISLVVMVCIFIGSFVIGMIS